MRTFLVIAVFSSLTLSISPYYDVDVFGGKFNGDVYRLLDSFARHTSYYGWFLKGGLNSLSAEAVLKASFWVEYVCYYYGASYRESYEVVVPLVLMGNVVDLPAMVSIAVVETKFRNTVGDNGKAMGYFQIHMDTALNALEFANKHFPKLIWDLPVEDNLLTLIRDLIQRPLYYKSNPDRFKRVLMKNRPLQSVIASLVYLHKAFMTGQKELKTDSMERSVRAERYLTLDLTRTAPVLWNSSNWLHYAPRFFYHYSKSVVAYFMFLKVYLGIETVQDFEEALKLVEEWKRSKSQ